MSAGGQLSPSCPRSRSPPCTRSPFTIKRSSFESTLQSKTCNYTTICNARTTSPDFEPESYLLRAPMSRALRKREKEGHACALRYGAGEGERGGTWKGGGRLPLTKRPLTHSLARTLTCLSPAPLPSFLPLTRSVGSAVSLSLSNRMWM